ncbi:MULTISPECIES: hypothetical protein [unclassified Bradyrhizobium]|uniref:hypothetical protein n=1 Tax=unclassified Bradyrhizobium TaxID=2631580 RepID=UPI002478EA2B|nr:MULTISPECIES: hypothetical protein [unclassified Bradyrhizobium]WGR92180.1 hypothetical protein MTX20_29025 [Bradyrhizobium sp. ISRA435]WGR96447.1 hypothetical protein MTX23_18375 [Bradyrhizobium sp. ISRA436]WGS03334.1 hypothetical protein MTX18_18375 [Bradyrhizobium sp. ISRA437]WGS10218.1 hypothetical protein MTX26_18375 [Bradyrhizobium sp. ISRA443]WGS17404.1 hypothetical protein MTX22_22360 [Bradyrhizobium sp. ISRA463]
MRNLTLAALAGAGALIASGTYAAANEFQIRDNAPLLHQARLVCNDAGRCWHTRHDRVIRGETYYYGPRRYYDYDDYGYYHRPGIGVYGPGFSFGIGPGY